MARGVNQLNDNDDKGISNKERCVIEKEKIMQLLETSDMHCEKSEDMDKHLKEELSLDDIQMQIDDIVWTIKKYRKKKGWTQKDLAKEINVSPVTIARMEAFSNEQKGGNPSIRVIFMCLYKLGLKFEICEINN